MSDGTASPANLAVGIDQVDVANLAVQQTNGVSDIVFNAASDQKVLGPVLLGSHSPQSTSKGSQDPPFERIGLVVDLYQLTESCLPSCLLLLQYLV